MTPSSAAHTSTATSVHRAPLCRIAEKAACPGVSRKVSSPPLERATTNAPMCCVIPPASPAATDALRRVSSSVVLPWSTCPITATTARRGGSFETAFSFALDAFPEFDEFPCSLTTTSTFSSMATNSARSSDTTSSALASGSPSSTSTFSTRSVVVLSALATSATVEPERISIGPRGASFRVRLALALALDLWVSPGTGESAPCSSSFSRAASAAKRSGSAICELGFFLRGPSKEDDGFLAGRSRDDRSTLPPFPSFIPSRPPPPDPPPPRPPPPPPPPAPGLPRLARLSPRISRASLHANVVDARCREDPREDDDWAFVTMPHCLVHSCVAPSRIRCHPVGDGAVAFASATRTAAMNARRMSRDASSSRALGSERPRC